MDLEKQSLEQHRQVEEPTESPQPPRLQSVTLPSLPLTLQGPLQGSISLNLDSIPLPHEVLPQPEGSLGLPTTNIATTYLVPPAPAYFLQQLQEESTTSKEGIAPLPIAPLPTFVGVPLPVAVETPNVSDTPSASVSLTVLHHPREAHGEPTEATVGNMGGHEADVASGMKRRGKRSIHDKRFPVS